MWGRIESGVVAEITDINPKNRFHPSIIWEPCPPDTEPGWLWDGKTFSQPPDDAASTRRESAIDVLDAAADRARAAGRSVGQYLDEEYQLVALALAAYRQSPDSGVPEAIQSYADAERIDVEAAAQQIAEAAARADERLQAVRRIRLAGKTAIRDAGDDADMLNIVRPFIDRLEALLAIDVEAA